MYITLDEYKAYKQVPDSDDDSLITFLIGVAQAAIEDDDYGTGRVFECTADTTRYFDAIKDVGDGRHARYGEFYIRTSDRWSRNRRLFLDHDCAAITEIVNGDGNVIPATEYVTVPSNSTPFWEILLKGNSSYFWTYSGSPENAISITGRWCYSITPDPSVVHVTLRLVDHLYEKRKNPSNSGNGTVFTDGGFVIKPSDLPPDVYKWMQSKKNKLSMVL